MVEEPSSEEQPVAEPVEAPAPIEEPRGASGPGFLLGLILGAIVGAALAVLLAPKPGEEEPAEPEGLVGHLRARVREATVEARQAAQEAEQAKRARFEQLMRDGE